MVEVDEVVGGISEVGKPAIGPRPARRRVGWRHELGDDRGCRPEGRVVEDRQVLPGSPADALGREPACALDALLPARVGLDQAAVDREALAPD